ncbi:methyl-accepting chemotaxis protein [Ideonella margarita]|uniref:Methyl-accepting chemotaxis protein n=1 Tax=Ideonella margarita TaxID=2984191 RepID=A0ABU9C6E5_9BURK
MTAIQKISSFWSGLRVGSQLTFAFAIVLLLTAVLGGVATLALGQVNAASHELAAKWLPAAGHLANTRAAMLDTRAYEVKLASAADASYVAEYEDKIKASAADAAKHLASYKALPRGDEEAELLAKMEKAWAAYMTVHAKVSALAREGKMDDAKDIGDGAGQMGADDSIHALDKVTAFAFAGADATAEQAAAVFAKSRLVLLGLVAASLTIGVLLAVLITRSLLRQLGGEPRQAVVLARAVSGGDLSTPITLRTGDKNSLMAALANMQSSLGQVVRQVREGSEQVATASAEIASGNSDLSARTEQQASALEQTAASMEELGSTVTQNADNARQADTLARSASDVALRGGEVVAQVVGTMREINNSSKRIADITGVIDGIAFQTNILALNAAVEAARAGEQGRGFAVVAGEVRTLAQRSAEAAREIKQLIAASVEKVEAGTRQVDEAGETMSEVVTSIQRVSEIVNQISAASVEQSSGVRQVGEAVTQMDQATQQNAALVEQSAAAAESLKHQATDLVHAVSVFRL